MPVPRFLCLQGLATELAIVGKGVGVVDALNVVPHIPPGGSSLLTEGAVEKPLVVPINKLVQLVRVNYLISCRSQYQQAMEQWI